MEFSQAGSRRLGIIPQRTLSLFSGSLAQAWQGAKIQLTSGPVRCPLEPKRNLPNFRDRMRPGVRLHKFTFFAFDRDFRAQTLRTPALQIWSNIESAQSGKPACRAASTMRAAAVRSRIAEKTRSMARMVAAGSSRGKRATC